ncbi:RlpA-like double-psi beta-barrel-protein domain-containing protein-containing protein [Biscogniauxia marginata]|nr:RlpA-like double-psi beta-barrel-protein domain-containing protein-containing protein [Biscogniauxia marginata]
MRRDDTTMVDYNQVSPSVFQLPDWEIPTPRPPRRSLINRLSDSFKKSSYVTKNATSEIEDRAGCAKETSAESSTLPTHDSHPVATANEASRQPTSLIVLFRSRFDAIFPPHRTYFGRPRRFVLLYITLPLAIFILVVLPLIIGLSVGLPRRTSQELPLPGNAAIYSGDLTYYDPALGACGIHSASSEIVCAVSHLVFDAAASSSGSGPDPNTNPLCGMKIRVQRDFVEAGAGMGNNRTVDVTVVDRCEDCAATDLDLSLAAFTQVALQESGRVIANWVWLT